MLNTEATTTKEVTMTQATTTARCDHRSEYGLGCARSKGHTGSHWLTAKAEAARADLIRKGFFAR